MRALALEHLRPDPVGIFGEVLAERGIGVDRVLLYGTRLLATGRAEECNSVCARALERFEPLGAEPWAARARSAIMPPDTRPNQRAHA